VFLISAIAALAEEKEEEEEEAKSPVIPVEVLALVLPHLDTLSLCQAALVSKAWLEVSRNPDVWQTVTIKNEQISSRVSVVILPSMTSSL